MLAFDLRRLTAYLILPVLAAAVSLVGIGEVSIIFPMIGAAFASYGLFAGDKGCGCRPSSSPRGSPGEGS